MNVVIPNVHENPKNCQLIIAITGDREAIIKSLKYALQQFDEYKKPPQGTMAQYGSYTTVITPFWNGEPW